MLEPVVLNSTSRVVLMNIL